jgi:hypothetical protein
MRISMIKLIILHRLPSERLEAHTRSMNWHSRMRTLRSLLSPRSLLWTSTSCDSISISSSTRWDLLGKVSCCIRSTTRPRCSCSHPCPNSCYGSPLRACTIQPPCNRPSSEQIDSTIPLSIRSRNACFTHGHHAPPIPLTPYVYAACHSALDRSFGSSLSPCNSSLSCA